MQRLNKAYRSRTNKGAETITCDAAGDAEGKEMCEGGSKKEKEWMAGEWGVGKGNVHKRDEQFLRHSGTLVDR